MATDSAQVKLQTIDRRLSQAGIQWLVFAGAAAHAYGCPRPVTDLDILVREPDYHRARELLEDIEDLDVLARLTIPTNQGTCSFFADDEMISKTRLMPLLGLTVPVAPVEDNVLLKAILQRGEDQGKHDIPDIRCMLENQVIDPDYLMRRMRLYNAEKRTRPLLEILIPGLENL